MNPPTIAFFGNFGTGNLGNECTLHAAVHNARAQMPDAKIICICTNPQETTRAHGVPAHRISRRYGNAGAPARSRGNRGLLSRLTRRVFVGVREILDWATAAHVLRGTRFLVMTGTGMLGDFGIGPWDLHYEILKWSVLAKLCGCRLLFLSVGVGPIADPLSRWMVQRALSLADYRSYRDTFSKEYLESIGFDTGRDHVYPDLAFSLDRDTTERLRQQHDGRRPVVGLGLMDYYGQRSTPAAEGERIYQRYVAHLATFARWLIAQGYSIRLLIGDAAYDTRATNDVFRLLGAAADDQRVIVQPIASPQELYAQLGETDVVVATRFHNVLLGLLSGRPVLALSYHEKVRSLMSAIGADNYIHDVHALDVGRLIEQFGALQANAGPFTAGVRARAEEYRRVLDDQYRLIFAGEADRSAPSKNDASLDAA